tara:strand:- start:1699 stop:2364 length:666 start_codon:yes stop_codon:yes gene_type:complete
MKNILIFGSGYHSKVVFSEIIKLKKYNFIGFIDERKRKGLKILNYKNKTYKNLGKLKELINKKKICGIIGVGDNYTREKIYNDVKKQIKNFKWEKIVSSDAIISDRVKIGSGSFIVSGSIINTGTKIGRHCIINTSSSIDHDNSFADFSSTGPGVITGGNVTVQKKSFLGLGCKIKHKIIIGKNTVVGANSYVNRNCESNSIYIGSPAKKKRSRKIGENYL